MGLRIGPAAPTSPLERTQSALEKTFERLSSLRRVNSGADDAAALALSENLKAFERAIAQGERNFSDGVSLAQTAEGGLSEIGNQLGRLRELTVQAGNSILGEGQRQALQSEADQITAEITRVSKATQFGGQTLLDGSKQGADAVTLRDGSSEALQLSIDDSSAGALGVSGLDVSDPSSLDRIDAALEQVSTTRAEVGTFGNRLESGIRNLQSQRENAAAANSRLVDADVAKQASELVKNQLLERMGISVQAQANVSAGAALHLLR